MDALKMSRTKTYERIYADEIVHSLKTSHTKIANYEKEPFGCCLALSMKKTIY